MGGGVRRVRRRGACTPVVEYDSTLRGAEAGCEIEKQNRVLYRENGV